MNNIKDIAKKAGVSVATVSRVINSSASVKEETRQRVLNVIEESGFTINAAARSLSNRGSVKNIGFIVPDTDNAFFASVLKGVTITADKFGYNIFLFGTEDSVEKENRFLLTAMEQRLRGIIVITVSEKDSRTRRQLKNLHNSGIPVVLVDREVSNTTFNGVFSEDEKGSLEAVQELVKAGHTKIATIAGPQNTRPGRERLTGYKRALRKAGLEIREEYIVQGEFKQQNAYEAAKKLLSLEQPPTAIFTANNLSTIGALQCFSEKNMKIGRDISLLGFDDIEALRYTDLHLSVVERPVIEMGIEAMNLLQELIIKEGKEEPFNKKIILGNQVILRGSERLPEVVHKA